MLYESIALPTELNWRPKGLQNNSILPLEQVDFRRPFMRMADSFHFRLAMRASISPASMGMPAIKSTGPLAVIWTSFSRRTPKPSSGM
jgi:hypothetical protein